MNKNKITISHTSQGKYKWVVHYPDGGTRKRKFFERKTGKDGAETWAAKKELELAEIGSKHAAITDEEWSAVMKWRSMVAALPEHAQKVTLSHCVEEFGKTLHTRNKAITCQKVADKLVSKLSMEGQGNRSKDLGYKLKQFLADYGDRNTCDIDTNLIDEFLEDCRSRHSPRTVKHRKQALNQMFNYAVQLKASPINPVTEARKIKVPPSKTEILSVDQTAALLANADSETLVGLVLSFFAGLRRAEIERLDWSNIKLSRGVIRIDKAIAKNGKTRNVDMSDNLIAWLKPYAQPNGKVIKSHATWRRGMENARKKAGIVKWPHNAGRHSFASYHTSNPKNGEGGFKTATALGHPNPQMLHDHYHTLVDPEECERYWNIYPPKAEDTKITRISA